MTLLFLEFIKSHSISPLKNLKWVVLVGLMLQSTTAFGEDVYPYKGFFAWPKDLTELKVVAEDGTQKAIALSPKIQYVTTGTNGNSRKSILFYINQPVIPSIRCRLPRLGFLEQDLQINAVLGKTRTFKVTIPAGATVFGLCGETSEIKNEVMITVFDPEKSIEITYEDVPIP